MSKRDVERSIPVNFVATADMVAFSGQVTEMCDRILSLKEFDNE